MRVRDLPLPAALVEHYEAAGIDELYPPQAAAVEAGVCEGDRVVAAVPTASGKTFVAELAMATADGPALYIVPLRALAREKYESFSELPGASVGLSTGDVSATDESLAGTDVVVATSEKVDSAIRNGADWVDDLACVVVDEAHLLGADGRGPTLEVTLATLQRRVPDVQIVALSATVDNPDEIADWLDATLVESDWRPVDLRTGVYEAGAPGDDGDADGSEAGPAGAGAGPADEAAPAGGGGPDGATAGGGPGRGPRVRFDDGRVRAVDAPAPGATDEPATAATVALAAAAVADGGQCLAFVRSRREAAALAERLADEGLGAAPGLADEVAALGGTGTDRRLADCVRAGVAFHHAGLRSAHRALVESAFRRRELAVICATPTLAAGVNVPARRVVVRDVERYTGSSTEPLPVLEVHQMCGRAGRPGLDPYGEAVLVGDPDEAGNADRLRDRYVGATPEAVESKLADRGALRTHVLSTVASGFADTRAGVRDLLDATFYAHQAAADGGDGGGLDAALDDVLGDLVDLGMVERGSDDEGGALAATPLGVTTSRQYLRPETGARVASGLRRVAGRDPADVTRLTALELVCSTPDMRTGYLGNRERAAVYQFARDRAPELTTRMGEADDFEGWLEAVKTARILLEYADGASVDDLVEAYRIGPGDLESRLERAGWLLGAVDALVETLDVDPSWAAPRELRETFREAAGPGPGPDSGTDGGGDQDPGTAG